MTYAKNLMRLIAATLLLTLTSCSGRHRLEASIEDANGLCPMRISEAMTISSIALDNGYVVYTCLCDEAQLGISVNDWNTPSAKSALRASVLEAVESSPGIDNAHETLRLCRRNGIGIKIRYIGSLTHSLCDLCLYEP